MNKTKYLSLRVLVLAAAMLSVCCLLVVGVSPARATDNDKPWVVAVGDSFISGEAGRWAGNQAFAFTYKNDTGADAYFDNASNTAETIERAHRSKSADIHIGVANSLNLAVAGSETVTVPATHAFPYHKPGLDFYNGSDGPSQLLQLQDFASKHKVKMVAVSVGGNDFEFSTIVSTCLFDFLESSIFGRYHCNIDPEVTSKFTPKHVADMTKRIATAYQNIRTAMRRAGYSDNSWTLVVQNYPAPLPPSGLIRYSEKGYTRQYTGGCGLWDSDADYAFNTIVPTIDNAVDNAIVESGLTNIKLLDLRGALKGHRLCEKGVDLLDDTGLASWKSPGASDKTEWVNQIRTVTALTPRLLRFYKQEGLHPNYWGQMAMRNCMRQVYNNGSPRSGVCVPGTGVNGLGEPNMYLR